jgi:F0F1-type ATP synthase gamma subunit
MIDIFFFDRENMNFVTSCQSIKNTTKLTRTTTNCYTPSMSRNIARVNHNMYSEGMSRVVQEILRRKPATLTCTGSRWSNDTDRNRLLIDIGSDYGLVGQISWEFMDSFIDIMKQNGYNASGRITGAPGFGHSGVMYFHRTR